MKVKANGVEMHYTLEGPANAPVVTLSHSLATDLSMWEPQLAALRARYRVLSYDTRGHGGTEAPAGAYSLDLLADDAAKLLAALGIRDTHWIGLSMGGMIGQALALKSPISLRAWRSAIRRAASPRKRNRSGPSGPRPPRARAWSHWSSRRFRDGSPRPSARSARTSSIG